MIPRVDVRAGGGVQVERKLMVVAHPDDEIIFGGAHLLQEKNWKVICVTNGNHPSRAREFKKVMKRIGADYEIWKYRDTYSNRFDIPGLKRDFERLFKQHHFAKVVTHGLGGEYGHPQHKVIARLLRRIVKCNLYAFSIGKRKLPAPVLDKKRRLLDLYPSQKRTIWELCRDDSLNKFIEREHFFLVKK